MKTGLENYYCITGPGQFSKSIWIEAERDLNLRASDRKGW